MNSSVQLCALCGKSFLDLGRFGFFVCALGSFAQRNEPRGVIRSDIRQDLPVQFYAGLLQAADELVIADALGARSGADADDPDCPVLTLLLLTAGVGEFKAALHRFFGS